MLWIIDMVMFRIQLAILAAVFFLVRCKNNVMERKEIYDNGKLKSVEQIRDGLRNGTMLIYDSNGMLASQQQFRNDTLNGIFIKYYENGNIADSGYYRNGRRIGKYFQFYPNVKGKILYETYFITIGTEEFEYYSREYDLTGSIVAEDRVLDVEISSRYGDRIQVEFIANIPGKYDSAKIAVGHLNDEFNVITFSDTLSLSSHRVNYQIEDRNFLFLRGALIVYDHEDNLDDKDSLESVIYTNFFYFEESLR